MLLIPSTRGARFYNMIDKKVWLEQCKAVATKKQKPSVTTILEVWPKGKAFMEWLASRMSYEDAMDERDAGGDRGTRVHQALEDLTYGLTYSFTAYAEKHFKGNLEAAIPEWRMLQSFAQWYEDYDHPQIITRRDGKPAIECAIYSWKHGFAGTTDVVFTGGKFGDKRIMVDYKTSKGIYDSFWAQLSAYFHGWHEMGEQPIDGMGIFHPNARKKCGYDFIVVDSPKEIKNWFKDFLACQRIWYRFRDSQNLPTDERQVHEVEDVIHIGKLADRAKESHHAWAPPDDK